ncbi:Ribosomal large subunit pseudouridine synthase F [Waddlia chondrophila 2032/99]|uniref:RNA pseudouridylate synthase family protein n=2 Tax=Waddlia chondrophila TaxID=71667 RepID=D6YWI1_WADCW|nr:pseudouridine synthase [Waddlia chondrophila]ADI38492.1 RNA pseudouridylate synthase family protein [Waddlia chondrophila WSU 86-1044]CCB91574.1 Ribosomal large subunit pseudouridine synthase F [Waddlia chondrophila 2032/99]
MNELRLSKLMSLRGICSRREADRMIEKGLVRANGKVISELGTKVPENAEIELLPHAKKWQAEKVTIILNKPIGYVSTQPEKGYKQALDLITPERQWNSKSFDPKHLRKLSVAGRLDIDSKGILILTQDGVIAKKIIGNESEIEKEYLVRVDGAVTPGIIKRLSFGLVLDNTPLKKANIQQLDEHLMKFTLIEGKKRQIRRMCELVGLKVVDLKRVRIGKIRLGDLPTGYWRYLKKSETI